MSWCFQQMSLQRRCTNGNKENKHNGKTFIISQQKNANETKNKATLYTQQNSYNQIRGGIDFGNNVEKLQFPYIVFLSIKLGSHFG